MRGDEPIPTAVPSAATPPAAEVPTIPPEFCRCIECGYRLADGMAVCGYCPECGTAYDRRHAVLVGWSANWGNVAAGRPVPAAIFTLCYVAFAAYMIWSLPHQPKFGQWFQVAMWFVVIAVLLFRWSGRARRGRRYPVSLRLTPLGWSVSGEESEASSGRAVPWLVVSRVTVATKGADAMRVKFFNGKKVLADVVIDCPVSRAEDLLSLIDRIRGIGATPMLADG